MTGPIDLPYIFRSSALPPAGANDNEKMRLVFTTAEIMALSALARPHVVAGNLKAPLFKKGEGISCMLLEKGDAPHNIAMAIVKQTDQRAPASYLVNFGLGYEPTATINFDQAVRLGRMHLERVFQGSPPRFLP